MYDLVSVNGLGGGLELGIVMSGGARLVHRTGKLDLGAPVVRGNRQLLGWDWDDNFGKDHRTWHRPHADVISANCPCSGFSTLTAAKNRGMDAAVNVHLHDIVKYGALLNPAPLIMVNESVQQAYSQGRPLMQHMRDYMEHHTGHEYHLTHILQSNASLGGASLRKRYFWVISRVPFGVEYVQPKRVARLGDALGDLQGLNLTPHKQPYRRPATWWSVPRRAHDGVDGHFSKAGRAERALAEALVQVGEPWRVGEDISSAMRRIYALTGTLPEPWDTEKMLRKNFNMGVQQVGRWDPDKQSNVITGAGPYSSLHYAENRLFTHRECARIQGFPDTWRIAPAKDYVHLNLVWGKGVPVDAGRWIGHWIKESLEGRPGTVRGKPIGERESVFNVTNAWKHTAESERRWEHQPAVLHEHTDPDEDHYADACEL